MSTPEKIFNVLDYGAIGDGVTDDTAAIQAAINAAVASSLATAPGGKLYAPPGLTFKTTATLAIVKPIMAEFLSMINYTGTSSAALCVGGTGWQQYYDLRFFGFTAVNGNSAQPNSVNANGSIGVRFNNFVFSRFQCEVIQGFTNAGVYMDGMGDVTPPQVIQHNRFDFGQIVNNGIGINCQSANAATSSVEANFVHISDLYQCFFGAILDNQNASAATTSNYFLIDALDDANQSGGGQGMQINGCFNRIDITYLGCNIWFGATSAHNTLNVYNTAATGATYTAGGSSNHYNIVT